MRKVNFRTNILLKKIIGKDMITDDNIAVIEFVKNIYDAWTSVVELVFEDLNSDQSGNLLELSDCGSPYHISPSLLMCDNKIGMDEDGLIS